MFLFVGLKSFQQRNVAHDHYMPIMPTSIAMAFCEFFVVAYVARHGFDPASATAIGVSSGAGSLTAMLLHKRMFKSHEAR
jgi:hypothetical protein